VTTEEPAGHSTNGSASPRSIADDWRVRDGNTLTWVPARQRYWMVAGWNGEAGARGLQHRPARHRLPAAEHHGRGVVDPDGVTWKLELPHGHGQFERRHSHNTVLWNDRCG
jgi:hypothetical protein